MPYAHGDAQRLWRGVRLQELHINTVITLLM
jgi:hypothetical protein